MNTFFYILDHPCLDLISGSSNEVRDPLLRSGLQVS